MKFCQAEFSTESLHFYMNVQETRNCPLSQIKEKAASVYRCVAKSNRIRIENFRLLQGTFGAERPARGEHQRHHSNENHERTRKSDAVRLVSMKCASPDEFRWFFREIFLEAEKHIIELMKKNSYPRFIQSEQYRNLLQNAPNPLPKKT